MATPSTQDEVAKRKRGHKSRERVTMRADLLQLCKTQLEARSRIRFPSPRYQRDPVAFCREILGVEPWSKQVEILEALRDHPRVSVSSGHKVSKSHSAACVALWYYCSFPDARVVMTSVTARQVDQILWRELRMVRSRGGRCVACKTADPEGHRILRPCPHSALIEGEQGELARTGLKSDDFREVVGFTAREAEAVAGISGRHLLYICDEASGIPDEIFAAIEGNRAGGARIVLFSNPTRNEGEHYESFTTKAHLYKTIRISSEETPNVVEGRIVIPGLATREWIEEKRVEWGEDSPLYKVRVRGEHATREDGKIFSIHTIEQAEQRWGDTEAAGRIYIGVDPAGPSGSGDESVFVVRRGLKMIELRAALGLNAEAHVVRIIETIQRHALPREMPVVVIDREGSVGSELAGLLRAMAHDERQPGRFDLVALRASDGAVRQPLVYDRVRDELAANLEAWFRDGGAIVEDVKLAAELHILEYKQNQRGKLKVTPKDDIRKALGRSPDRYDALALSVWEPLSLRDEGGGAPPPPAREDEYYAGAGLDPYAGSGHWGGRR